MRTDTIILDELMKENERLNKRIESMTPTAEEWEIMRGQEDGCIRIADLRPIQRRIWGEAV